MQPRTPEAMLPRHGTLLATTKANSNPTWWCVFLFLEFSEDVFNGQGVWTHPGGDRYEGQYKMGTKQGVGSYGSHMGWTYTVSCLP